MARDESPPFVRGGTLYDGETIDSNDLLGAELLGYEWVFEDKSPTDPRTYRTGRPVRCRAVRNVAAAALLPKRVARFSTTAGKYLSEVDGYATITAGHGKPIDEYLPTAGVPVNDVFWIVVDGPAVCLTGIADMAADIGVGDWVVALTAATSGATTSGRVHPQTLTGSSQATDYTFLALQIQNRIGRALTARTTTGTASDILIDVGHDA